MRLTAQSNRILKVYRLMPDTEREKLARVRLIRRNRIVLPSKVADLEQSARRLKGAYFSLRGDLRQVILSRARMATFRRSRGESDPLYETWTPIQKASDLEAQTVLWAIEFRERGLIEPEEFDIWTRAWREVGLTI